MKKFLSLVLALAMTMSLVTISAGAKDFADADEVTYTEAVDVMTAIGVIDGDAAGNVNPTAGLTRGAAAKIICNLILGPTTAADLNADAAPYKDVAANSTFAGYIAFCQKEGIISGYADGTFKPAAPLTGYAFMKMLLGALGYDAAVEGYTGANWSINVAKQALGIDLNDGLVGEFNGSAYVTREEAMLYAFNTLKADMVEYDAKTNISVGGAEVVIAGSKAEVVSQGGYKDNLKADNLQFAEKYFKNLERDPGHDDFGRPSNTWTWKNEEVGEYAVSADATWTTKVTEKALYAAAGSNAVDNFTWKVYVDSKTGTAYGAKTNLDKTSTDRFNVTGNGVVTELYVDSDSKTVDVVIVKLHVAEVNKIKTVDGDDDTLYLSVKGTGTRTFDIEDASDFAKEDIVVVTIANDKVKSVVATESVSGKVSGYKTAEYAKMDGTTYNYNYSGNYDLETGVIADPVANDDAVLYLDPYGYVIGFKAAEASDDYLYVKAVETSFGSVSAKVVFADGTSAIIDIDDVDGKDAKVDGGAVSYNGTYKAANTVYVGAVYSYTKTGDTYDLTTLTVGNKDGQVKAASGATKKGTATFDGNTSNTATVFVDVENTKVYEGYKNVPSFTTVNYVMVYGDNKVADVVFLTSGTSATDDGEGFFVVTDTAFVYEKDDDNETWTYTVYVDGVETDLVANKNLGLAKGVYEISKVDGDGYVDSVKQVVWEVNMKTAGTSAVDFYATAVGNGTMTVVSGSSPDLLPSGTYLYDDETVFVTVSLDKDGDLDTVSVGSTSDIAVDSSNDDTTCVYVVEVEDKTDATPLAELVVVVVPY